MEYLPQRLCSIGRGDLVALASLSRSILSGSDPEEVEGSSSSPAILLFDSGACTQRSRYLGCVHPGTGVPGLVLVVRIGNIYLLSKLWW